MAPVAYSMSKADDAHQTYHEFLLDALSALRLRQTIQQANNSSADLSHSSDPIRKELGLIGDAHGFLPILHPAQTHSVFFPAMHPSR